MANHKHPRINHSIHPRNGVGGKKTKSNTCAPGMAGKYLRKARERLAARRLDFAHMIKSLSNSQPETAFRNPGSMKWR